MVARSVVAWFRDEENTHVLERLMHHVTVTEIKKIEGGPLHGQTVVVTGTLPSLSREDAESMVKKAGGQTSSSVSRKTSFVLAGENPGSKLAKAKELNVPTITEEEFLKRLAL